MSLLLPLFLAQTHTPKLSPSHSLSHTHTTSLSLPYYSVLFGLEPWLKWKQLKTGKTLISVLRVRRAQTNWVYWWFVGCKQKVKSHSYLLWEVGRPTIQYRKNLSLYSISNLPVLSFNNANLLSNKNFYLQWQESIAKKLNQEPELRDI